MSEWTADEAESFIAWHHKEFGVKFQFHGETLTVKVSAYADGNTAFVVTDETGMPYAKLSVNVPGASEILPEGSAFVKHYSENAPLFAALIAAGVLIPVGLSAPAGMTTVTAYTLAP